MTSAQEPRPAAVRRPASPRALSRRALLASSAGLLAACTGAAADGSAAGGSHRGAVWRVPAEHLAHRRTWMAWPSSRQIWGRLLPGVQDDIALVAATIARYEPVVMLARSVDAAEQARRRCGPGVRVLDTIPVDDCWIRDSGPVFRFDGSGRLGALGLGFDGWGGKQLHDDDALVARRVAHRADAVFGRAGVVGEGGGVESDGQGTLIATESCWVDDNRNPGRSRDEIERDLLAAYGARTMIWVPGVRGRDITDDHIDATTRFVRPGVVLVQVPPPWRRDVWADDARRQRRILARSTDAHGRRLEVVELAGPDDVRSKVPGFLDSYVNFALPNGAVVAAQLGDRRKDAACRATLMDAFPGREVVQLDVDRLHRGGGGIHCVTQQQPRLP